MIYTIKHTDSSGLQQFETQLKNEQQTEGYLDWMLKRYGEVPFQLHSWTVERGSKLIRERKDFRKRIIHY